MVRFEKLLDDLQDSENEEDQDGREDTSRVGCPSVTIGISMGEVSVIISNLSVCVND